MLTTCTACGTQFRVNTEQLRAVHGLVRCSRCHSVFDAFETLQEEFESTQAAPEATPPDDLASLEQEITTPKDEELPPIPASIAVHPVEAPEVDIHIGEADSKPPADDLFADLWGESAAPKPPESAPAAPPAAPMLIEDHIPKPPDLARDQALYKHKVLPPRERRVTETSRHPWTISGWGVGAVLLVLALGVQVVNANRLTLSQSTLIGAPLSSLYAALGHPLKPSPTLSTWLVSDINVTSDPDTPGALSITGALENQASFAQPWPQLRVELTDRYGDPLRARDFTAGEYLPANQSATWLGPGMATHFRIDVVDPGPDAVGFQIRPCLQIQGVRQCGGNNSASD